MVDLGEVGLDIIPSTKANLGSELVHQKVDTVMDTGIPRPDHFLARLLE